MSKTDQRHKAKGNKPSDINGNVIFAMDIGTRSIIGVAGIPQGDMLKVIDIEIAMHPKRAMVDGQIEDIEQVALVAATVKKNLEQRLGTTLKNVFVAAAGRALKTKMTSYTMEINPAEYIQGSTVTELEMMAVQQAYSQLDTDNPEEAQQLYCVGHSVVKYYLDDYPISTLIDHRGKSIKAEVIATFLPGEVVESLYSAMERIGLSVSNITLEPIAAINAIIPPELRLINLALVDIGAGTSDIAISNDGSVTAYTMATVAGDEITEAIIKELLVDFETAENIKFKLSDEKAIEYKNILGFSYSLSPQEILDKIRPSVDNLCDTVCQKILEVNGKPPAAVFLVGGGSMLPNMCSMVAKRLGLGQDKVVLGSNNFIKKLVDSDCCISGPEFATPVGIAITALQSIEMGNFSVTLNGEKVLLFRNTPLPVMDILLMKGYKHSQIIGRSGKSVTFMLNGKKKTARGGYPTAAEIQVNSHPASITTEVKPGDKITIVPATNGTDAAPFAADYAGTSGSFYIKVNGNQVTAGITVTINGKLSDISQPIREQDNVEVHNVSTVSDLLNELRANPQGVSVRAGGKSVGLDYALRPGDFIEYSYELPDNNLQREKSDKENKISEIMTANSKDSDEEREIEQGKGIVVTINNKQTILTPKHDNSPYLFVDMLNFVDIDPQKPQGNIILKINGENASFLQSVNHGDIISIYWDKA